jgi:CHAT domain-containing protein/tetratricopeptide (TPR) repeat protein
LALVAQAALLGRLIEPSSAPERVRLLLPGVQVESYLRDGERQIYEVSLAAGQTFHATLRQLGTELRATLDDPLGRRALDVGSLGASVPPEPLLAVATVAGRYRLEISARRPGGYSLMLDPPRQATAAERSSAQAAAHFSRGYGLLREESETARRKAIQELETAWRLWDAQARAREKALTAYWLGRVHKDFGEVQTARTYFAAALKEFQAERDRAGEAVLLDAVGRADYKLGEYAAARTSFEQSLTLFRAIGDRAGEADLLNNIALLDKASLHIQEALDAYQQALALWEELGGRSQQGIILNNIGNIYREMGKPEQALRAYFQALSLQRGEARNEALTLSGIGKAYSDLGIVSKSLQQFSRALQLSRWTGDGPGEILSLTRIGFLFLQAGQLEKASARFREAMAISRRINDRRDEAIAMANLARVEHLMGNSDQALETSEGALRIFQEMGDREATSVTLNARALTYNDLGRLPEAKASLEESLAIVEKQRAAPVGETLKAGFFSTVHQRYELYIDILEQLDRKFPKQGYGALAFEAGERARARAVLDELAEAHAAVRADADPKLIEQEQRLLDQINLREAQRQEWMNEPPSPDRDAGLSTLGTDIGALILQYDSAQAEIRSSSPRYTALSEPKILKLADVQRELLDNDTSLLAYSLSEPRSFAWVVSRSSFAAVELPGRGDIERAAFNLQEAMERGRRRNALVDIERAAQKLSNLILKPLAGQLKTERLLIVADGALHATPFTMLPIPCPDTVENCAPEPLLAEHEIVSIPSASALAALRRARAGRKPAPHAVAALADGVFELTDARVRRHAARPQERAPGQDLFERQFPRLTSTQDEAEAIISLVPPGEGFEALGFDVNLDLARSPLLGRYRILHFATHGILSEFPELSGLVLSRFDQEGRPRDGFLRALEIYNLDLPVDLVVLSACQTAKGGNLRGEGVGNLTRAFLYAGAEKVVVSLWNVSDRPTAKLMARFYQGMLQQGLAPAAALRAAQLATAHEKGTESPYYWAGFVLQGDWR